MNTLTQLRAVYVDVAEASQLVGLSAETLKRHLRAGTLVGRNWGQKWLIEREELRRFAVSHSAKPGPRSLAGAHISVTELAVVAGVGINRVRSAIHNGEIVAVEKTAPYCRYVIDRAAGLAWAVEHRNRWTLRVPPALAP